MKLIIDIDEDVRIAITRMGLLRIPDEMQKKVDKAIQSGTPLPKGHGRIIDEWKITKFQQAGLYIIDGNVSKCLITDAPTIIEADKAERRG